MLNEQNIALMGLKPHHFKWVNTVLRDNSRVNHAWIFGSRALGTFKDSSDIDIALQGEQLTLDDIAQMQDQFEQSCLPFKVDFVVMHKIKSIELVEHIKQRGLLIF